MTAAGPEPWWQGAVLYQVYPLSFRDSDGDGWGDLEGVIQGLPAIADLGVDAIWLSPFFRSGMADFGYDVIDHCAVEPLAGTLDTFDRLVARAHSLGLKVILDQVWAHTSAQHPWFQDSRSSRTADKADWYLWADARPDGTEPTNWRSLFGGPAWEWSPIRRQYHMHHFLPGMPHLRVQNPAVQEALLDIAGFWLDRGVDGFRFDVANLFMVDDQLRDNPPSGVTDFTLPMWAQTMQHDGSLPENFAFVGRIRALLDEQPGRYSVAEVSSDRPDRDGPAYSRGDGRFHSAYTVALGADAKPDTLAQSLADHLMAEADSDSWPTHYLSNHDFVRGPSRVFGANPSPAQAQALLCALMMARGNIHLYQGDELGLPHANLSFEDLRDPEGIRQYPHGAQRDGARTPYPWAADQPNAGFSQGLPWLPVDAAHLSLARDTQADDPSSTLGWCRRLLALRRSSPLLRTGSIKASAAGRVLTIVRRADKGLTAHINLGPDPARLPAAAGSPLLLSPGAQASATDVMLPPWGCAILSEPTD
jgi:alpha-glucosidase